LLLRVLTLNRPAILSAIETSLGFVEAAFLKKLLLALGVGKSGSARLAVQLTISNVRQLSALLGTCSAENACFAVHRLSPRFLLGQSTSDENSCLLKANDGNPRAIMGRGRKAKTQKMKNRKRQAAKKSRIKKKAESVRKSRAA
jgi:hypothetical protein